LVFVGVWNALSIVPETWALLRIHEQVPALQKTVAVKKSKGNAFATLWAGWATYISSQRIFLVSFAYTLLYWTALRLVQSLLTHTHTHTHTYTHTHHCTVLTVSSRSPGALMSAYLLTHGINEVYIALYTGASSVVGIIPTFFTTTLFKRFGIEKTGESVSPSCRVRPRPPSHQLVCACAIAGMYAIWGQDACLLVCVVFFFVPNVLHVIELGGQLDASTLARSFLAEYSTPYNWSIWAFLLFLIFSRMGLWTFDLAERQIMQVRSVASARACCCCGR
jgi:hypothetical protein